MVVLQIVLVNLLVLRVDTKLPKTVDPDEHAMDSLLV